MNKAQLKTEIENLAKETESTFIQACSSMQGACAKLGKEDLISASHELKMESLNN